MKYIRALRLDNKREWISNTVVIFDLPTVFAETMENNCQTQLVETVTSERFVFFIILFRVQFVAFCQLLNILTMALTSAYLLLSIPHRMQ